MSKIIDEREYLIEEEILKMHWPTEAELPCQEDNFMRNYHEQPQSGLLNDCITPILLKRHPNRDYSVGHDVGIYWRLPREGEVPQRGAICPDWFYVPGVSQMAEGGRRMKRSHVMWHELISPFIALEFVSGNGSEERDYTPYKGKFWIYEQAVKAVFYGIFEVDPSRFELYHLVDGRYQLIHANERGHFPVEALGIEFGFWSGLYHGYQYDWLRIWDLQGNLLLTGSELAEEEHKLAERERQKAEEERQKAEEERQKAEEERQKAEEERQKAEEERQKAEEERQKAEEERQKAEKEHQRAEEAEQKAKILAEKLEKLRAMGIDVDSV